MNLCRCEKGHFYDKEKYATCPHCAGGSASDDSLTTVFTNDDGIPGAGFGQDAFSAASGAVQDGMPVAAMPAADVTEQIIQNQPFPEAAIPADQPTVAVGYNSMDTPTVPLVPEPEEDNDHTIGIFDNDFWEVQGNKPTEKTAVKYPAVNKVSTPCVGWLIALGGEHVGTDFRLKAGKNFVGRNPDMDIALTEDKSVSRERHAIVVYEPKAHLYLVQPGESSSLVYKNNEVVLTPMRLEAYDMITVGDVNLLFMPLCGERFNWSDLLEEMRSKRL